MMQIIRSRAGRLCLLASGVLLTCTVGHAAARMMATQMAVGQSTFAFELAAMLAALLVAAYTAAFCCRAPKQIRSDRNRSTES